MGVSTGLAYTGAGGDILRIETVVAPGKGDFHLTGQLGEVMQESVTAAWGYLKTAISRDPVLSDAVAGISRPRLPCRAPEPGGAGGRRKGRESPASTSSLGRRASGTTLLEDGVAPFVVEIGAAEGQERDAVGPTDHEILSSLEVRMHLPEGGVPKEGPSAGVAVAVSLLSALTLIPLAPRVALSGEITLTGQVLAVGGLKEKLLAALREGVRKVVLPADVRPQIQEVPRELTRGLEIVYVSEFKDVLPHVLCEESVPPFADVQANGPAAEPVERRKGG